MDPEFALEWFNTEAGRFHFLSNAKTTSGLSTLNSQDIKTAPVPVPESKELQKELVAQLRAAAHELRREAAGLRTAADAAFAGAVFGVGV
jgi:type I restriction enzyme S subunit